MIVRGKNKMRENRTTDLEAFAVDDAGAGLIVFMLGDPHLLEGG